MLPHGHVAFKPCAQRTRINDYGVLANCRRTRVGLWHQARTCFTMYGKLQTRVGFAIDQQANLGLDFQVQEALAMLPDPF